MNITNLVRCLLVQTFRGDHMIEMETKFYSHLWRVVVCISPSAICQTGQLLLSHAHGVVDSAYTAKKKKVWKNRPKQ